MPYQKVKEHALIKYNECLTNWDMDTQFPNPLYTAPGSSSDDVAK